MNPLRHTVISRARRGGASPQRGAFLLEALIAILIFSLGILGLIGVQAQSIRYVSGAQYRGEAAYLVSSYLAKMWAADPTTWATAFVDPSIVGSPAETFQKTLFQMPGGLPGAAAIPKNPTIVVTPGSPGPVTIGSITLSPNSSLVTVTVWWLAPGEVAAEVDPINKLGHQYVASSVIGMN